MGIGGGGLAVTFHAIPILSDLNYEFALAQKIPTAKLKNSSGKFIEPTIASISAAAKGEIPSDTRLVDGVEQLRRTQPPAHRSVDISLDLGLVLAGGEG